MAQPSSSGTSLSLDDVKGRSLGMSLPRDERRNFAAREAVVRRIVAEFHDMPGLLLSVKQASRFLGVDEAACARILVSLTPKGRSVVGDVMPAFNRHESLVTQALTESERDDLARSLRTILRTIEAIDL